MKYTYIVLSNDTSYWSHALQDIQLLPDNKVIAESSLFKSKLHRRLFNLHFSRKINNLISLPKKELWWDHCFNRMPLDGYYCFIFLDGSLWLDKLIPSGLIEFLKARFKNSKFACFFSDFSSLSKTHNSLNYINNLFDIVLSYDKNQASKYNITYYPLFYSISSPARPEREPEFDVHFTGVAKNRYSKIIDLFSYLRDNDLKCDFHIVGVPIENQRFIKDIDYGPSVPYSCCLTALLNSKAIAEVVQKSSTGRTFRFAEAIAYNRLLITNNTTLVDDPLFDHRYMMPYSSPEDIDIGLIKDTTPPYPYPQEAKKQLSPIHFIEFLDSYWK